MYFVGGHHYRCRPFIVLSGQPQDYHLITPCKFWIAHYEIDRIQNCTCRAPSSAVTYVMFNLKPFNGFGTRLCGQANEERSLYSCKLGSWYKRLVRHLSERWRRAGLLSPRLAGNMLPATQHYVFRGDVWNERRSFNPLPGKAATESPSNLENLWATYLWRHSVHYSRRWRMKDQLDVICYFISLIMRSTCFGH